MTKVRAARSATIAVSSNNRFERSRGASSANQEGLDDVDQLPSFDAGEAPRRSTSSLDALDWGRRNFVSSLRSAAQPLLIEVAQIHRSAVLEMTAAHGRRGTDER